MPRLFLRCVATLTVAQSLLCGTATQYSHGEETTFVEPTWRYVTQPPSDTWFQTQFDDSKWQQGLGGFGDPETPGARVGTNWSTNDIWLRREFEMSSVPAKVGLLLHHDEDVEVYINGAKVKSLDGYTTEYQTLPLDDNARGVLKPGKNTLAVHCHQTGGGQFIDVHVVDTENAIKLPQPPRPTTPFKSELITRWGAEVTADNAWREYPRPQMVRSNWQNLNGMWDYAVAPKNESSIPTPWDGKILVPFCLESKLSGVQRLLDPDEALWYHRTFSATKDRTQRSLLNFEAVDYACRVWVNGHQVGSHQGGNVPFQLDITDVLVEGSNELIVRVDDATEQMQLRGKQTLKPRGIWYTQVSGIWQTVWLEQVPLAYLQNVKISTDAKAGTISLRGLVSDEDANRGDYQLKVVALDGDRQVAEAVGPIADVTLAIADAKKWSPSSPHLYDLTITLVSKEGQALDEIKSYAGIRDVGKVQDENGHWRFTLNGNILFHWGTLDQGWWPDGLLTPPSDAGMAYDVQFLKDAGFNMIRKHIKVEPRRYYYHCDRLGMMLWQDQVSGGNGPRWSRLDESPQDAQWSDNDHQQYLTEFAAMVDSLENHPSIVTWIPFNEAWGQHRTMEVGQWIQQRDPSRNVNIASGGNFWPVGDVVDHHQYPHPDFPFSAIRYQDFIKVVGEFGGHGLPVAGHLWDASRRNWGYGNLPKDNAEYQQRYRESIRLLNELRHKGIAAGVYTQTTDVEGEINGLLTYDRNVAKIPAAELREIHSQLFQP